MYGLILGLAIPLAGTVLGAAGVYAIKERLSDKVNNLVMGFAAGIMIAAAVWSLMIPSMEMVPGSGMRSILPAVTGVIAGTLFLLLMDRLTPHRHAHDESGEGPDINISRTWKLVMAIILHNIPEGMAIGVAFAAVMEGNLYVSVAAALALSIGIAIQNVPEGAIVSLPLRTAGNSRNRAFIIGVLSGVVQPVAAIITIWLATIIVPMMPWLLGFAAGAMIYVVVEELIPASTHGRHSNIGPLGFIAGFVIMLLLDAALA